MHHVKPLNHMHLTGLALLREVLVPVKNNLHVITIFYYTSISLETFCT